VSIGAQSIDVSIVRPMWESDIVAQQKIKINVCIQCDSRYDLLLRRLTTCPTSLAKMNVRFQSSVPILQWKWKKCTQERKSLWDFVLDFITTRLFKKLWTEVGLGLNVTFN